MKIFIFLVVAIFSILPNISLAANGSCGGRYSCSSGVLGATAPMEPPTQQLAMHAQLGKNSSVASAQ